MQRERGRGVARLVIWKLLLEVRYLRERRDEAMDPLRVQPVAANQPVEVRWLDDVTKGRESSAEVRSRHALVAVSQSGEHRDHVLLREG